MQSLNTQVRSSDVHVIASLCGYSTIDKAWTLLVYVNGGASVIRVTWYNFMF